MPSPEKIDQRQKNSRSCISASKSNPNLSKGSPEMKSTKTPSPETTLRNKKTAWCLRQHRHRTFQPNKNYSSKLLPTLPATPASIYTIPSSFSGGEATGGEGTARSTPDWRIALLSPVSTVDGDGTGEEWRNVGTGSQSRATRAKRTTLDC
uniref:Uncharacterized protein n=1 Tax=Arundo donax TaxID=35708 RepID=A0A0A9CDK8_ARUDO